MITRVSEPTSYIRPKNKKCQLCGGYITNRICDEKLKLKKKQYCYACEVELHYYKYTHQQKNATGQALMFIKKMRIKELGFVASQEDEMERRIS